MGDDRSEPALSSSKSGESDIVELAMNRDPEALGTLYDTVYPPLFRLLYFSTRDPSLTEEIAEDILPSVLAAIPYAGIDAPSLRAWMMSVAWHLLERHHRQTLPSVGYHLPPHFLDEASSHTIEYRESADVLSAAIRQLPAFWQNYVVLRFVSGLARTEAAFVLGKTLTEVEAIEADALQELGYWIQVFEE